MKAENGDGVANGRQKEKEENGDTVGENGDSVGEMAVVKDEVLGFC